MLLNPAISLLIRAEDTNRNRKYECHDYRHERQLRSHRQALRNGANDLLIGYVTLSKVTGNGISKPIHVTDQEWIIKAEVSTYFATTSGSRI